MGHFFGRPLSKRGDFLLAQTQRRNAVWGELASTRSEWGSSRKRQTVYEPSASRAGVHFALVGLSEVSFVRIGATFRRVQPDRFAALAPEIRSEKVQSPRERPLL